MQVLLINYIALKTFGFQDVVVVSHNLDAFESAHGFAKLCTARCALIDKMMVIGDVKGKIAILYDDFIDTSGELIFIIQVMLKPNFGITLCCYILSFVISGEQTLFEAAILLRKNGASRVYLCAVHSIFRYMF